MKLDPVSWWTWHVSGKEAGMSLLAFLKEKCTEAPSIKALKRAIESKCCIVNSRLETFSSRVLNKDDSVALRSSSFSALATSSQMLKILFEDAFLLICNKLDGVVCEKSQVRPFIAGFKGEWELVHRLDKETTGALMLAKSSLIKRKMVELFRKHQVQKTYLAIVDGVLEKEGGTIDNYLGEVHRYQGQTIYGVVNEKKGSRAITHWKCLAKGKNASLVWCEPKTGRTHQLRVHLSGLKHPILGDAQYAERFRCPLLPKRHLLHAYQLCFPHPMTGELLKITAPISLDFKQSWERLLY